VIYQHVRVARPPSPSILPLVCPCPLALACSPFSREERSTKRRTGAGSTRKRVPRKLMARRQHARQKLRRRRPTSISSAGRMQCDLRLIQHVLTILAQQTRHMVLLENVMTFPTIEGGKALAAVLGWLGAAGFTRIEHRVLSVASVTGLAQARRRWVCVATKPTLPIPGLTFRWPSPIPEHYRLPASAGRGVVANAQDSALCPHPRYCPAADGTHRRANTQHCQIYDVHGLAPGSNSKYYFKYNERHQRVGRRDQGASATTEGAGSASGAQPFPLANRAGCSHAANWQCNTAGAGRGFI
jgi:site-specific DNA-cytosine methylase